MDEIKTTEKSILSDRAIHDACKELDINVVITGEGSYILDCTNGVEYSVDSEDDYEKVVSAIRLLQEKEKSFCIKGETL